MYSKRVYFIIGFMLFALFFGAANLIYPAYLGLYAGQKIWAAILGFCLTGVSFPLLGVMAVASSGVHDLESLAHPISKWYAVFFTAVLSLAVGPFFAIPRTGATSFAIGIAPVLGTGFPIKLGYAIVFFGLAYLLAVYPRKLAENIGKYLTPSLILIITILIAASFLHPAGELGTPYDAGTSINLAFSSHPFITGLIQGYGTMDALASLIFASLVIEANKIFGIKKRADITKVTLISGLIAIGLLAFIYIFIGRIGATSQSLFYMKVGLFTQNGAPVNGSQILSHTAQFFLGNIGQVCLGIAIFLACLTTATGLITSSASYFHKLYPRLSQVRWTQIFTLLSASFYFGGLDVIIRWSTPVLYLFYPLTIALIFLVLTRKLYNNHPLVYRATIFLTIFPALYDALESLSELTYLFQLPQTLTEFFRNTVPLGNYSLGWICFTLIGYLSGLLLLHYSKKKG
ncbi:branched-chain amino acid transport system II carrier protein [Streptococcus gallinaceus]|uniref:Branched-chain amino acid transport system carrier protein n=1 Tax=Streptococcus gallinaceus TaxID=165758 RepID=A0ABV2JJR7_9STRE